jgi:hypothetical protein
LSPGAARSDWTKSRQRRAKGVTGLPSPRDSAAALRVARTSRSRVQSTTTLQVASGIRVREVDMCSATRARTPTTETVEKPGPAVPGAVLRAGVAAMRPDGEEEVAAVWTSDRVTMPSGPEPGLTDPRSTPRSRASLRTGGDASGLP